MNLSFADLQVKQQLVLKFFRQKRFPSLKVFFDYARV